MNLLLDDFLIVNIFGKKIAKLIKCRCASNNISCSGMCLTNAQVLADMNNQKSNAATDSKQAYTGSYEEVVNFYYRLNKFNEDEISEMNFHRKLGSADSTDFRPGVLYTPLFSVIDTEDLSEQLKGRFEYVRSLCSTKPLKTDVCVTDIFEEACILLANNNYEAVKALNFSTKFEFIGVEAVESMKTLLVCRLLNPVNSTKYPYKARSHLFTDFLAEALTLEEQKVLLIHLILILNTEVCEELRKLKSKAILDRLLFEENKTNALLRRAILYYDANINGTTEGLVKLLEGGVCYDKKTQAEVNDEISKLSGQLYATPLVLYSEIEVLLATNYIKQSNFDKALPLALKHSMVDSVVCCLVKLNRCNEAVALIRKELENMQENAENSNFTTKVKRSNYYIQLATITNKIDYFDRAYSISSSYEPLIAKAHHLFKLNDFIGSLNAFKMALYHVPNNAEINFSYSCCLVKCERYNEAIDVLEKLSRIDLKNIVYLKNLTFCYLKLGEVESGLKRLKEAAVYDSNAMEQFMWLSVKNDMKENILWAFSKSHYFDELVDIYNYLIEENRSSSEVICAIKSNPKLRKHSSKFNI